MKTMLFTSSSDDHSKFNGPVVVLRKCTTRGVNRECDAEVGPMFRCRATDGSEFSAFSDELTEH